MINCDEVVNDCCCRCTCRKCPYCCIKKICKQAIKEIRQEEFRETYCVFDGGKSFQYEKLSPIGNLQCGRHSIPYGKTSDRQDTNSYHDEGTKFKYILSKEQSRRNERKPKDVGSKEINKKIGKQKVGNNKIHRKNKQGSQGITSSYPQEKDTLRKKGKRKSGENARQNKKQSTEIGKTDVHRENGKEKRKGNDSSRKKADDVNSRRKRKPKRNARDDHESDVVDSGKERAKKRNDKNSKNKIDANDSGKRRRKRNDDYSQGNQNLKNKTGVDDPRKLRHKKKDDYSQNSKIPTGVDGSRKEKTNPTGVEGSRKERPIPTGFDESGKGSPGRSDDYFRNEQNWKRKSDLNISRKSRRKRSVDFLQTDENVKIKNKRDTPLRKGQIRKGSAWTKIGPQTTGRSQGSRLDQVKPCDILRIELEQKDFCVKMCPKSYPPCEQWLRRPPCPPYSCQFVYCPNDVCWRPSPC